MKTTATLLLLVGCATARPDARPTTPAAPTPTEEREAPEAQEAQRLAAELETSLANPPPVVPEPTPPDPFWAGYMVVNPAAPSVAILFAEDAIIDEAVLDHGVRLAPEPYGKTGWRFPVTRGAQLMSAVRIDDQHVTAEMPIR
ncbi:MAG: hypothetical protein Q8Q85_01610, partial [Gemmatimonadales bacterium]|nr:hypothetical protein [Gemmatimonadales bacterium]